MEITNRHVYSMLGLTFAGMVVVAIGWEFILEDLVIPVINPRHEPEPLFERWEYVVTSLTFFGIALIVPGWMAMRSVAQNERSRKALGRANESLALRVEQRTAELINANEQLQHAMDELRRNEKTLRESDKELRLLSSRLLTAQEDERQRVARDLHDRVSQLLSALKFKVEHHLGQTDYGDKQSPGDVLVPLLQEAIEEVRGIYMSLRPSILDDLGIIATINWFCRRFQETYPDIQIKKTIEMEETDIPAILKIVIFRVLEEGLNNVSRHSQSDHVSVCLRKQNNIIEFSIQDRGIGFQVNEALSAYRPEKGMGLTSMKGRVELVGGRLDIRTGRGSGTLLHTSYFIGKDN